MPGKTTYYARIQKMIDLASASKSGTADDFIRSIVRRSPPNFVYNRWDERKEVFVGKCSEAAVRKTFAYTVDLGLIERSTGRLTTGGRTGSNPKKFDQVIKNGVAKYFRSCGIPVDDLEKVAADLLHTDGDVLPTADEIYFTLAEQGEPGVGRGRFKTMLQLFAAAGGISISRKHIFLPKK